jgi:putative Mn2+ efflux pump MntP
MTYNRLLIGLAMMMTGWVLALHALHQVSVWATLVGIAFLTLVGLGVARAARV